MLSATSAPSTDHQLRSIISQYSTEGAESDLLNTVIATTARELLDKGAILLTTVHDLYTETLHPAADPKPAAYVLGKLKLTLQHHLHVVPPKSRKDGTLLLRNGCNAEQALHMILSAERKHKIEKTPTKLEDLTLACSQHNREAPNATTDIAAMINGRLRAQAAEFKFTECDNIDILSDMNMESVIKEIDPQLWQSVWTIVNGQDSAGDQDCPASSPNQHTKRVRCIFIISLPSCTFPLQLALADFVDAHSKSTELMKALYKVGAVAGVDTYKCYQQKVIAKKMESGVNSQIPDRVFSVATVDNIDKNEPGKRMFCGDEGRGFHGTSIQSVTPKPLTGSLPMDTQHHREPHQGFFLCSTV